ncbi:PIG-L deacetylase family protein [Anaerosacchariphilus polymeriproducens]|uniref:PIG-L family deacetylase n=1 Tax=Anaerosacchariphilus polymeriproducens TaxID=1812858 RepID=A0A371AR95_9FIRM|nr:PIG-L family deacetylase [Anaerosacchariphilus polymeriproducens]RDU22107.1 PIG-L family deacetylase [Anaerosacchariphilus polymeriproducens]
MSNILVIAAHPDDEIYGMGGTIAKLADQGHKVYTLIVTEGCSMQYPGETEKIAMKKEEAIKANELLGVKKVIFGELPDMKLDSIPHVQINGVIENAVRELQPDIVYTHHFGDVNKDHKMVYESTLVAVRPLHTQCVKEVYCYQVPSSSEWAGPFQAEVFLPNVFESIEKYSHLKEEAILAYNTEIREFPHPRSLKYVNLWDSMHGARVGLPAAEAFQMVRSIKK